MSRYIGNIVICKRYRDI